jgi:hypothetical protein
MIDILRKTIKNEMKITIDNYKKLIPEENQSLMFGLLIDLEELNTELENIQEPYRKLYIDYITEHTEYSPERTEPLVDYYGMYRLIFEKNPYESVGTEMTIDELDNALCVLINFIEFKLS